MHEVKSVWREEHYVWWQSLWKNKVLIDSMLWLIIQDGQTVLMMMNVPNIYLVHLVLLITASNQLILYSFIMIVTTRSILLVIRTSLHAFISVIVLSISFSFCFHFLIKLIASLTIELQYQSRFQISNTVMFFTMNFYFSDLLQFRRRLIWNGWNRTFGHK